MLAYVEGRPGNPEQNPDAEQNIQRVIRQVIAEVKGQPTDVLGFVAGLAGLNDPKDLEWAERFTNVLGETCAWYHVSDSVVAHSGALLSKPGIIAISGTGWSVYAVTETDRRLYSENLAHFSGGGAWHLSCGAIHAMIGTGFQPDNQEFIERVLAQLQKPTLEALREEIISFGYNWSPEFSRTVRSICPLVTEAAQNGIALAQSVCNTIAIGMAEGIKMLGSCFISDTVTVALMGSVLRSPYIKRQTELALANRSCRVFHVVDPTLSGTAGAALLALQHCGVFIDDALIARLRRHPMAAV